MQNEARPIDVTTIKKTGNDWTVSASNRRAMGPYRSVRLALQVAVTQVLISRKNGSDAQIFVEDDYGDLHPCPLIERAQDADRCAVCEGSWIATARPRPPRCLLWNAFRAPGAV